MKHEGPPLEVLVRRLIETPAEFCVDDVDVAAVVWDVLRGVGGEPLSAKELAPFSTTARKERKRLRLVLLGCWLLAEEWFRGRGELREPARRFLAEAVPDLVPYLDPEKLTADPDRREELIRHLLGGLDLRPAGESASEAADRLQTLDSAERQRVLRASAKAEKRAQEIREAMARAAARDAASRYGE